MREHMKHSDNNSNTASDRKKQITSKQVAALAGILLLALLYIVTLIVAIFDSSESGRWFMICIFATVAVPMLLWIYIWMYGKLTGNPTITDSEQIMGTDIQDVSGAASDNADVSDNISGSVK